MPRILHEWVHVDLPEHLDWEARRRRTKTRQTKLMLVKTRATQLVTIIQKLNAEDHLTRNKTDCAENSKADPQSGS